MTEAALVSVIALLGWLVLIWRSGSLRTVSGSRKAVLAATWLGIFAVIALFFQGVS